MDNFGIPGIGGSQQAPSVPDEMVLRCDFSYPLADAVRHVAAQENVSPMFLACRLMHGGLERRRLVKAADMPSVWTRAKKWYSNKRPVTGHEFELRLDVGGPHLRALQYLERHTGHRAGRIAAELIHESLTLAGLVKIDHPFRERYQALKIVDKLLGN